LHEECQSSDSARLGRFRIGPEALPRPADDGPVLPGSLGCPREAPCSQRVLGKGSHVH